MYGAEDWLADIIPLYRNLVVPSSTFITKYPSLNRSKLKLNIGFHKQQKFKTPLTIINKQLEKEGINKGKWWDEQLSGKTQVKTNTPKTLNLNQRKRLLQKYPHLKLNVVNK